MNVCAQCATLVSLPSPTLAGRPVHISLANQDAQLAATDNSTATMQSDHVPSSSSSSSATRTRPSRRQKSQAKSSSSMPPAEGNLWRLSNLPFEASEQDVLQFISEIIGHPPIHFHLITCNFGRFKGRSRGLGFVTIQDEDELNIVKLQGKKWQGREIKIEKAQDKTEPAE